MKKNLMKSGAILGIGALLFTASCKKEVAPGFTASATDVAIGENVSFTDNEEQRKNSSYMWDFGDGTSSSDRNPSHVYTKAGTYTVSQTISLNKNAEKGKSLKASSSATVTVTGPTANFTTASTSYATGEPIVFTNTTTSSDKGYTVEYNWSYVSTNGEQDDWIGSTKNLAHTFNNAGVYTVTLTARQGNTESTKSVDLIIGGATAGALTKSMIVGDWKFTSDVTVISGSNQLGTSCPTNGTYNETDIPATVNFEHDGDLAEFFPIGNQTQGNASWWTLSEDGKFMTYGGDVTNGTFKIKTLTATSLVLEVVNTDDPEYWNSTTGTMASCGTVSYVQTVTFTK